VRNATWLMVTLGVLAACRPVPEGGVDRSGATEGDPDLVASLDVRFRSDTAELALHVMNARDEPIDLEFATAQRYEFAVYTTAGEAVWRWSADRVFAQVTGAERIGAGEALEFRAAWPAAVAAGPYIAEGRLLAQNRPVVLRTELEVPAR
jgi:hypothetical protein